MTKKSKRYLSHKSNGDLILSLFPRSKKYKVNMTISNIYYNDHNSNDKDIQKKNSKNMIKKIDIVPYKKKRKKRKKRK